MAGPSELSEAGATRARHEAELPRTTGRRLLVDELAWASWYTLTVTLLSTFTPARPALVMGIAMGMAVVGARPRALFMAPALVAATLGVALAAEGLGLSPILAAGATAGLLGAWLRRDDARVDALDLFNAALATAAGAGLSAWLVAALDVDAPALGGLIVGLGSASGLIPGALRWRAVSGLPTLRQVRQRLAEPYRPPVLRALELHGQLRRQPVDRPTLDGVGEVAGWVYDLALTLQTLDRELSAVQEKDLAERIELALLEVEETADPFTRDRRLATVAHMRQLLGHAETLRLERQRSASLQEYALAWLEEARLGLVLARTLPGDATPQNLTEVLGRLRAHAREGEARRRTARELGAL